jgi:DNA-nicking Smr family endonuclease
MSRDDRRRGLTYEERVLWTTVTKSFKPLRATGPAVTDGDEAISAHDLKPVRPAARTTKAAASVAPRLPPKPEAPPQAPPLAPPGRRMKQRVARGKQPIDARLDLHGLTQREAHSDLLRFLRNAGARGARLVLVITGKGSKARGEGQDERGVLRRQVPQWLGLPEFRALVIGFEDAHIAHGGEGALYVWVRKVR